MKKIVKHTILIIAVSLGLASCASALDLEPKSSWSDSSYYKNEEQLRAVLYGGYSRMQAALGGGFVVYGDFRSDLFSSYNTSRIMYDNIVNNAITPYNTYANWGSFYQIIQQANLAIKYSAKLLTEEIIDQTAADEITGQAYCMRAFAYFWIVRVWGGAPLVLTPSEGDDYNASMTRSSTDDLLAQIHTDLHEAQSRLTDTGDRVYFTLTAAYAVEAQVCAWQGDWEGVIEANTHILKRNGLNLINNTSYSLAALYSSSYTTTMTLDSDFYRYLPTTDYIKMFNEGESKESIFELSYSIDDNSSSGTLYGLVGMSEVVRPSNAMKTLFTNIRGVDWRFFVNFYGNNPRWTKYFVNFSGLLEATRNVVLLRLSDMVLLEAEALINLMENESDAAARSDKMNTAIALVNLIRNRAGGTANEVSASNYDPNDTDVLRKLVADERLLELYGEGYRYFDLVRTGTVIDVMRPVNGQSDVRSTVWPIYYTEVLYSNGSIEQNEYYK